MPELPEVETVVRQLKRQLVGRRVLRIRVRTPSLIRQRQVRLNSLVGRRICAVVRRGKLIRIDLSRGGSLPGRPESTILVHLRMTGRMRVLKSRVRRTKHDHIDLELDGGFVARFSDIRKFGGWWIMSAADAARSSPLGALGPEPLEMGRDDFRRLLGGSRQRIKALLLDQRRIAGIGNIYCDESLFSARIHPFTAGRDVSRRKAEALWRAVQRILRGAIRHGGSSTRDFVGADGERGWFQIRHSVYGRGGLPCRRCGTRLRRLMVAGRGTVICPRCQPMPRATSGRENLRDRMRGIGKVGGKGRGRA